jgi:hypothetical protein
MKRAATCAALVAVLAVAAVAVAGTKTYRGKIEGDAPSSVSLRVSKKDGERQIRSFAAKDFVINCDSGPATLKSATITGRVPVNDKGKFKASGESGGQELRVAGKLSGKRNADGTVRYSGPTPVDGTVESCNSGKLDWTASR